MSLYALDEQAQSLLQEETFRDRFSAKDFIEQLSKNHTGLASSTEALDPKPYIRTFEAALQQLQRIQSSVLEKETNASKEVEKTEISHSKEVINISHNFSNVLRDFGTLDNSVGDIYTATSDLNTHLEKLSVQYEKSVESSFLINCYLAFYRKSTCLELDKLWEGMTIERRRCANVTRQLQILAKKIDKVENADNARNGIDKFAEKLERDLLTDFDNAYRSADLAAMKDSADILTDFNGGGSVIQMFVNQHDYFIVQEKLVNTDTLQSEELWIKLSDPDGDSKELEDSMQTLIDEIEQVIVTEMEIIKKVFRNSVAILKVFLQRVFAQRIQQQVEACLMIAEEKSTLAYMRSLHICYSKVGALTKSLKDVFASQSIDNEGELSALLDQNFADIFVPYIESGRYFEAEMKSLNQIIAFVLGKFSESHSHKLVRDHSILSRFTSISEHNKEATREGQVGSSSASVSEKSQGRIGQFIRAVRLERSNSHHKLSEDEEGEYYEPDITLEQIQKILSYAAESIKRDLELADSKEIPNDAKTFLHLLLEGLGRDVAEMLLDESITSSNNQEIKNVDLGFLKVIRQVSGFIFLISSMVHTVIAPMLSSNTALKSHTINSLNAYLERCETKMNTIIQSAIDLCLSRITFLLNKQKKKDYAFKSGSDESVATTQSCLDVCHFLGHIHTIAIVSLDGRNLELFLHEIGVGFKGLVLDHYKKFNVSAPGALVLSKDVQEYQMEIDKWNIGELSEDFGVLHSVANLFTAQPDAIQSLIRGSNLSQVKPYILKEYLQRRGDYFTAGINVLISPNMLRERNVAVPIPLYPIM